MDKGGGSNQSVSNRAGVGYVESGAAQFDLGIDREHPAFEGGNYVLVKPGPQEGALGAVPAFGEQRDSGVGPTQAVESAQETPGFWCLNLP